MTRIDQNALRMGTDEGSLRARVSVLEAALSRIAREAEIALRRPDVSFLTTCRISTIARRTSGFVE